MMKEKRNYSEVSLDGQTFDRNYKNPMTKQFQYEYALYKAISGLFEAVSCRSSICVESLKLYFKELPYGGREASPDKLKDPEKKHKTQDDFLNEMAGLVDRELTGKVTFPLMHLCRAEVFVNTEADGSHTFRFTDGIYSFNVKLCKIRRNGGMKLNVQDMAPAREEPVNKLAFKSDKNAA